MRKILDNTFRNNLIPDKGLKLSDTLFDYFLGFDQTFNVALVAEDITKGQKIEKFRIDYQDGKEWKTCIRATTVGYKRLLKFREVKASKIRLVIESSRGKPVLRSFGLYKLD